MKKWKAYSKIMKVIDSCESREQLGVAERMINNFGELITPTKIMGGVYYFKSNNLRFLLCNLHELIGEKYIVTPSTSNP